MDNKNTLFPELPHSESSVPSTSGESKSELPELDFDSMFANSKSSSIPTIHANSEDGTVDIREFLGKCGRETEADRPVVIVTQTSIERGRRVQEENKEEVKEDQQKNKIPCVVLDSGAIFRRFQFEGECEYVTCQDVIDEIRDEATRHYLETQPYNFQMRVPTENALNFVIKFSKETGDYQSLSGTDMKVLALAYFLTKQRNEDEFVRKTVPEFTEFKPKWLNSQTNTEKDKEKKKKGDIIIIPDDEWEIKEEKKKTFKKKYKRNIKKDFYPEAFLQQQYDHKDESSKTDTKKESDETHSKEEELIKAEDSTANQKYEEGVTEMISHPLSGDAHFIDHPTDDLDIKDQYESEGEEDEEDDSNQDLLNQDLMNQILVENKTPETNAESEQEEDDCNDLWITPNNINEFLNAKNNHSTHTEEKEDNSKKITVKVVTSDFSMQNVLMQMGIPVLSVEGIEIRQIRRFKLRCQGCKTINKRVDVEFCEKCGGHTLIKVSVFANSNGEITFFKGKRLKKSNRGVQYDIPIPKGGRHANNLILREDQLLVGQNLLRMREKNREEAKIQNNIGNHFNDYVSFELKRKENEKFSQDLNFGYGKKNPNIPKTRYSKKKRK